MDKTFSSVTNTGNILLLGNILLANFNYTGHLEYCINAILGGAIWMAFKLSVEYIDRKRKNQKS